MTVDVLAIGAHPDDVELGIGGLLCKLTGQGRSVAILDLTRGELATRGTPETREAEAHRAAAILQLAQRENAGLPDGQLTNTIEQREKVLSFIRAFRPTIILAPMDHDRHPDHDAAHALARDANFLAGLARIDTGQEPYRAPRIYFYRVYAETTHPSLVVDISDEFQAKLEALRAYESQFYNPAYEGASTYVSSKEFWDLIHVKAAYWGSRIGAAFGEPLHALGPVGVPLPPGLEVNP